MPRKTRRPPPFVLTSHSTSRSPRFPVWLAWLLSAVLCGGAGAGGVYLATRKHVQDLQASLNQALAAAPPASTSPVTAPGVPPPGLTAGLDEGHAALNLGNWYEDHSDWANAIKNYSLAVADGTDNPDIRTDLGVAYYRANQPQKALEQYQNAQKQNPAHENSLFNEGAAYAQLGQADKATAIWQRYLARFPQGQHGADAQQLISEIKSHGLPSVPAPPQE